MTPLHSLLMSLAESYVLLHGLLYLLTLQQDRKAFEGA